jgi:hypothetical protein
LNPGGFGGETTFGNGNPAEMMHKTYELVCRLPAQVALERIKALLSKEHVKYRADHLSVTSTQTPIVFVNLDPRLYSRRNWVGLNPFAHVSGIDVRCESGSNGLTRVVVRVNRFRAVFLVAWVAAIGFGGSYITSDPFGVLVSFGVTCAAWFFMVPFLGGYLIKKEIGDHLKKG